MSNTTPTVREKHFLHRMLYENLVIEVKQTSNHNTANLTTMWKWEQGEDVPIDIFKSMFKKGFLKKEKIDHNCFAINAFGAQTVANSKEL